jgi:hypothetical protein
MRRKTAQGLALRARIVLASAEGRSNAAVAARLGISQVTVIKWRARDLEEALGICRDLGDQGHCTGSLVTCAKPTHATNKPWTWPARSPAPGMRPTRWPAGADGPWLPAQPSLQVEGGAGKFGPSAGQPAAPGAER